MNPLVLREKFLFLDYEDSYIDCSSCHLLYVTRYFEVEGAHMQNMQGLSQLMHRRDSNLSNMEKEKYKDCVILDRRAVIPESKTGGMSSLLSFKIS